MSSVVALSDSRPLAAAASIESALARIDAPTRDALNEWLRERCAPVFRLGDVEIALAWTQEVPASWRVVIEVGAGMYRAVLALDGFAALDPLLVGEPFDLMPAPLRDLAIHRLATRILSHAPTALTQALELRAIHWDVPALPKGGCQLPFRLQRRPEGTQIAGCLSFDNPLSLKWLHALLPVDQNSTRVTLNLPVPLRLLLGRTKIEARLLDELEAGDVVLIESASITRQGIAIELCTGGSTTQCWARCRVQRQSLRIVAAGQSGLATASTVFNPPQPSSVSPAVTGVPTMDAQRSQLEVPVTFDLGELHLKLADLQRLQPGYIIELEQDAATATVALRVASRCIAQGSLIAVGKRLGVRVDTILARRD